MASVERLSRHGDTYDQTFVRLELLVRRPDVSDAEPTDTSG